MTVARGRASWSEREGRPVRVPTAPPVDRERCRGVPTGEPATRSAARLARGPPVRPADAGPADGRRPHRRERPAAERPAAEHDEGDAGRQRGEREPAPRGDRARRRRSSVDARASSGARSTASAASRWRPASDTCHRAMRAARAPGRSAEWTTRPRILVTNDDGIESRGLLALKQALEPIGDVYVVAPETNQSAVGHQKTFMRPLRVRERTLADGSIGWSVDGSPTDAVSLAFLGYFDIGFDLVASGINYGANLGDDVTYSGTVSAAMEAVINDCPAFAISQEYYEHPDFTLAGRVAHLAARQHPRARPRPGRAAQHQRARPSPPDELRGHRGHADGQAHLPGPAHRAARPARHPLLLDRRPAAVRARRAGHRLPRRRQRAHRRSRPSSST